MQRPYDENDYFDRWVRHYSEAINTNLCPDFQWFKVELREETKTICATLKGN